jgi:serine/threonine protein kinase
MLGSGSFSTVHAIDGTAATEATKERDIDADEATEEHDTSDAKRLLWCEKRFRIAKSKSKELDFDSFFRETAILSYLNYHEPDLAPKIDINNTYVDPTTAVITMERFDGDLQQVTSRKVSVTFQTKMLIFTSLCRLVRRLHQLGIIHGDLKPSNILYLTIRNEAIDTESTEATKEHDKTRDVTQEHGDVKQERSDVTQKHSEVTQERSGVTEEHTDTNDATQEHNEDTYRISLCDFGISILNRSQSLGSQIQTETYRAPELYGVGPDQQYRYTALQLQQAEIYSLGICALELLLGMVVYEDIKHVKHKDESLFEVLRRYGYFRGRPIFHHWLSILEWGRLDPVIRSLIIAMIDPNPEDRPTLAEILTILTQSPNPEGLFSPDVPDDLSSPEDIVCSPKSIDPTVHTDRIDLSTSLRRSRSESFVDHQRNLDVIDKTLDRIFFRPTSRYRFLEVVDEDDLLLLVPSANRMTMTDFSTLLLSIILVRTESHILPHKIERVIRSWSVRPSFNVILDHLLVLATSPQRMDAMMTILHPAEEIDVIPTESNEMRLVDDKP